MPVATDPVVQVDIVPVAATGAGGVGRIGVTCDQRVQDVDDADRGKGDVGQGQYGMRSSARSIPERRGSVKGAEMGAAWGMRV